MRLRRRKVFLAHVVRVIACLFISTARDLSFASPRLLDDQHRPDASLPIVTPLAYYQSTIKNIIATRESSLLKLYTHLSYLSIPEVIPFSLETLN
jgi:hypothetical protein